MGVSLRRDSIDLGIVIADSERSLAFYRDLLGFEHEGDIPMPIGDGGTMHRLWCGTTLVKLVKLDSVPPTAAPGGIAGATGYRYFTMQVDNLEEITEECRDAGVPIVVEPTEVRPGVRIVMVEDPDGNWVEFVDAGA
jgi:catechol 2,3-dioxygenase-like lactoylglutathione lyase family enzyme